MLGLTIQGVLSEHHRRRETTETVRIVVAMLVTFTSLVLGLLTTSVKSSFDKVDSDIRGFATEVIQLDQSLRMYGDDTGPAREQLRTYITAVISSTWTGEPSPQGDQHLSPLRILPGAEQIGPTLAYGFRIAVALPILYGGLCGF